MKNVPYQGNAGNACALACYTMAAKYLLPDEDVTFEKLAEVADWKQGYVVWGFAVWKWLMDRGLHIVDYDTIDYLAWSKNGQDGLKVSVPEKEWEFYKENTFDLKEESKNIILAFNHPNFTYKRRRPTWEDVLREHNLPGVCDVTVNSRRLNHKKGFSGHRVVLLDITDKEVVFNNPQGDWSGEKRREPLAHFRKVFKDMEEPELARYYIN